MSVIPLGGAHLPDGWAAGPDRLVLVPPGRLPEGARVIAVVALLPPGHPGAPTVRGRGIPAPVREPGTTTGIGPAVRTPDPATVPSAAGERSSRRSFGVGVPATVPAPARPASAGSPSARPASVSLAPAGPASGGSASALNRFGAAEPLRPIGPGLVLDLAGRMVFADGEPLELTRREFDLLAQLAACTGRVLSRDQLLQAVWGPADAARTGPRTVDVHVARLRRKLGERYGGPLHTLRGVGYRWSAAPKVTGQ